MQSKLQEQLSSADAEIILGRLPVQIQAVLIARAAEIEYLVEAVIEMAIAISMTQKDWVLQIANQDVDNKIVAQ